MQIICLISNEQPEYIKNFCNPTTTKQTTQLKKLANRKIDNFSGEDMQIVHKAMKKGSNHQSLGKWKSKPQ